ncbi:MAG: hypothetical protein EGR51_00365, partial [Oscillibacter sp.]|nr:hypothetical protein [Oscillibacter sp.]
NDKPYRFAVRIEPTGLQLGGVVVGVKFTSFTNCLIGHQIIQVQTEDNSVIVGAERLGTILTTGEEANMIVREATADTLHEQLEISLPKSEGGDGLSSLRVWIIRAGDMIVIVSEGAEPSSIMGFTFEHQTVGPLTGILNAAAKTLAAGKSNRLKFIHLIGPGIKLDNCFSSLRIDEFGLIGVNGVVTAHTKTTKSSTNQETS